MASRGVGWLVAVGISVASAADAQWADPRLVAGQVAFGVGVSFFGKVLVKHRPAGAALKEALREGAASGLLAHAGYCIAGSEPRLALAGKALAQKSSLMMRRSIQSEAVFDQTLVSEWALTHSFLYFRFDGRPHLEVDVINAAGSAYFLLSRPYELDARRSLWSGTLWFRNPAPPADTRGLAAPGVIWVAASHYQDQTVLGHEIVHSLQSERGAGIYDWHYKGLRFNFLAFAEGVPALLSGWPEHDRRWHEREADLYAGRK
jgi:hypothetical protein